MTEALPLLDVQDLTVEFQTRRGIVRAVQHVNVSVAKGETLAIVGESGSGKSVTSYAVMRILDRAGRIAEGSVYFTGLDIRDASEDEMRNLRGREMSMIFQNPRAALNPIRKVGHQIEDVLRQHAQVDASGMLAERAIEILDQVKIARPRERYHAYPFELSGGMCQRVVIALALACRPQLLIADEPTTGLDVTTQKTVMDLVMALTRERGMSTILITHDLGLAATYCDRVVVMEKGNVVETATARKIFTAPSHAYTRKLMLATPRPGVTLRDLLPESERAALDAEFSATAQANPTIGQPTNGKAGQPLLVVEKLVKEYPRKGATGFVSMFKRKPAPEPETFKRCRRHLASSDQARRKRRPCRRVRLRQVHDLDDGHAAARPDRWHAFVFDGENIGAIFPAKIVRANCPCANASRWCSRIRPTASIRDSPPRARSPTRSCSSATCTWQRSAVRARCEELATPGRPAARPARPVSRTSSPADKRRASASHAPSRSTRNWSFSTSRPRRSTCRCRRSCSTCCRNSKSRSV